MKEEVLDYNGWDCILISKAVPSTGTSIEKLCAAVSTFKDDQNSL